MERSLSKLPVIGILISGTGSNMEAIIKACQSGALAAQVGVVISNNPDAKGLKTAAGYNIHTMALSHRSFETREAFDEALVGLLREFKVDVVALAGFLRLVTPTFLKAFHHRVVNIHPSLLPKFKGLHAQQQAFDAGEKETGCTVHYVTEALDDGPIIAQEKVTIEAHDTVETLTEKLLKKEHELYPKALAIHLKNTQTI